MDEKIHDHGREQRNRTRLNFANAASENFAFLREQGFAVVEYLPTLVRYRKGEIEVGLYHGRGSFEVGFEIVRAGERYHSPSSSKQSIGRELLRGQNFYEATPRNF